MLDGGEALNAGTEDAHFVSVAVDVEVLRLPLSGSLRMTIFGVVGDCVGGGAGG
jgi:hypothetical protein